LEATVAFLEQIEQVAQLSQRNRTAEWVSYSGNISGSPLVVPVINALVLSGLCEYRRKSYIAKTRFFGLYFCCGDNESIINHFDVISPRAIGFGEITQNNENENALKCGLF